MGLEVQLFHVRLKKPTGFEAVDQALHNIGCTKLSSKPGLQYYEVVTDKGITEFEVDSANGKVGLISVRFSFGNPSTVIEQTFRLFSKLSAIIPIEIFAVNLFPLSTMTKVVLKSRALVTLRVNILKREKIFEKLHMKIDKPIRGGQETFDYLWQHEKLLPYEPKVGLDWRQKSNFYAFSDFDIAHQKDSIQAKRCDLFTEDALAISSPSGYRIDLGWHGANGSKRLIGRVIKKNNKDDLIEEVTLNTFRAAVKWVNKWIKKIEKIEDAKRAIKLLKSKKKIK